jgi:hypothetical protein
MTALILCKKTLPEVTMRGVFGKGMRVEEDRKTEQD